ncbi:hypothetical protein FIC_00872 [Flavobacteriaceae bacterium 3519-10]|nr:hypothetical protein FIC_00872 [Flavobacteriaceae bacterium 3519-10]
MKFSNLGNCLGFSAQLRKGWKQHPFIVCGGFAAANNKRYSGQPGPSEGMEVARPKAVQPERLNEGTRPNE